MDNVLGRYFNERVRKELDQTQFSPGPVVTISRQYGCYASEIAQLLTERLNLYVHDKNGKYEWTWIAKEVLDDAAKHLEIEPARIAHMFAAQERSVIEDFALAFSVKKYARDPQIKKTISQVVRQYAEQGHVIIVGRAGCVLANHIEKALHVKLIASDKYRVEQVKKRFNLKKADAVSRVAEFDLHRKTFMRFYNGDKPDANLFDMVLNREKMSNNELVESLFRAMEYRNIIL